MRKKFKLLGVNLESRLNFDFHLNARLRKASKKYHANLSSDDLLKNDKSVSIHQRHLEILAADIYKVRNDLGPEIMKDIFHFVQKSYKLRNDSTLQRRRNCTVYFGTEKIYSLAPKIWEIVPCQIKNAK